MDSEKSTLKKQYFAELGIILARKGFEVAQKEDGSLAVRLNGEPLCCATTNGIRYRREDIDTAQKDAACDNVSGIVVTVKEYMTAMETAPTLKAEGLEEKYRLLVDFGGTVLAGKHSSDGAQFVTWSWDYDHNGVTLGHYFGNDFIGAKEDFAKRSGLVPKDDQFTPEQLIEIYRCCADTMRYNDSLRFEQEQRIDDIQSKITELVPDYVERFKRELDDTQQTM